MGQGSGFWGGRGEGRRNYSTSQPLKWVIIHDEVPLSLFEEGYSRSDAETYEHGYIRVHETSPCLLKKTTGPCPLSHLYDFAFFSSDKAMHERFALRKPNEQSFFFTQEPAAKSFPLSFTYSSTLPNDHPLPSLWPSSSSPC